MPNMKSVYINSCMELMTVPKGIEYLKKKNCIIKSYFTNKFTRVYNMLDLYYQHCLVKDCWIEKNEQLQLILCFCKGLSFGCNDL